MPSLPNISNDVVYLHSELLVLESGLFLEGDQLAEKEDLDDNNQLPPMLELEVHQLYCMYEWCTVTCFCSGSL